jgi:transposase
MFKVEGGNNDRTQESAMKLYGGIDLHSNNSLVVLADEQDRVVYRRRPPNDLAVVLAELAPFADSLVGLVVESI